MIDAARAAYGAELALLTCSAVPRKMLHALRDGRSLPVLKIDDALACQAVRAARRIGAVVTFIPTLRTTSELLAEAAADAGVTIEIVPELLPDAYHALLAGNYAKHDDLLCAAVRRLDAQGVDAIVLAQVSMTRILPVLNGQVTTPLLSSLSTSLAAIREHFDKAP